MESTTMSHTQPPAPAHPQDAPRALRILAKSVFRELKSTGHSRSDIVAFATEMLSLVSTDLRAQSVSGQSVSAQSASDAEPAR